MAYCRGCGAEIGSARVCPECKVDQWGPAVQAPPVSVEYSPPAQEALERAGARMKSYTNSAVVVFFLYWLFWLPGLIFNVIYMNEARRAERIAGHSLPGTGCLKVMLIVNLVMVIGGVLLACILLAAGAVGA